MENDLAGKFATRLENAKSMNSPTDPRKAVLEEKHFSNRSVFQMLASPPFADIFTSNAFDFADFHASSYQIAQFYKWRLIFRNGGETAIKFGA